MVQVNIHEAKTKLSNLLETSVHTGNPFIIAKYGKPIAKVVPIEQGDLKTQKRVGFLEKELAEFVLPADFDEFCQDEISAMFYESSI